MSELTFEDTGIEKLDNLLSAIQEASYFANNSTNWDEIDWEHNYLKGNNPYESIVIAINDLTIDLKKHNSIVSKLKRQGFIE